MNKPIEEWYCFDCETNKPHSKKYIAEQCNPYRPSEMQFICEDCKSVFSLDAAQYFDAHTCSSKGDWCYCDDTMHKHCDECDGKCSYNRDYEC